MSEKTAAPLRIVRLEAENVKRLVAVEITPEGNLVVVGGKNGAGKSSVLDSIAMALGGKDLVPALPLRKGADHGHVEVELNDGVIARRTFTAAGGGSLTLSNKEGAVFRSPQALLDRLLGRLSFDPLAFVMQEPRQQRETLRALVGLDFVALEAKRLGLFEERTAVSRTTKALEARLAAMTLHADAPAQSIIVGDLLVELDAGQRIVNEADEAERAAQEWERDIARHEERVSESREHRAKLESDLTEARRAAVYEEDLLAAQRKGAGGARAAADAQRAAVPDLAPIRARIASAEEQNRKGRENADRAEQAAEVAGGRAQVEKLSAAIEALDAEKAKGLAGAAFPVPGLSFDEHGVVFQGVPFAQASSAEQLRVSVAMGLALNPTLRVLLVRDGSLLDADNLRLLGEMAAAAEAQVWLEVVREDDSCTVILEDGRVRGVVNER